MYVCPSKQLQLDAATDVKVQVHITALHSGSENFLKIQAKKNSSNEMNQIFFSINIPFSEIAIYLHDFTFGLTIFFSLDFLKFSGPL